MKIDEITFQSSLSGLVLRTTGAGPGTEVLG
jgi:hypothetical protein